ncbi:MAG: porin [Proteobacteria bacterium]|nr:porin [Pseudomonadota bacterium]
MKMKLPQVFLKTCRVTVFTVLTAAAGNTFAADKELLDILLSNDAITSDQHRSLMEKPSLSSKDFAPSASPTQTEVEAIVAREVDGAIDQNLDQRIDAKIDGKLTDKVAAKIEEEFPVKASYGSSGFRLASRDGNWQTNLGWRAQLRYTNPTSGDPRQIDDFEDDPESTFEARRLRMKIGGFGYRPWLGYYFEVDLQPSRTVEDSSSKASARVIDWRITAEKWDWAALRVGQWKIDYNRERVDSSGRQQFVERSIVNRIFSIDRQVGAQLRGHLFKDTLADMRYYAGVFTGEGRGVKNDDDSMMWMGRLQWNFLGRDLDWKQTDVEYTELPTGSLAFAAATNEGRCTRWSSSGCGNLDGFTAPADAVEGQFEVNQVMQEFAFKWRGFSAQQEFHWKTVEDNVAGTKNDFTGAYAQAGYFFHYLFPVVPKPLELAFRYAFVKEPNEMNRVQDNVREEFTVGANWFIKGHNNKLTVDFSHLTLEDKFFNRDVEDDRGRVQWDISF